MNARTTHNATIIIPFRLAARACLQTVSRVRYRSGTLFDKLHLANTTSFYTEINRLGSQRQWYWTPEGFITPIKNY